MQSLQTHWTLTVPDDWHLHLRDGTAMAAVVGATARCFARALVMPNLKPPITTVSQASAYLERIMAVLPLDSTFSPLMTLYLTEQTSASEVVAAQASGFIKAIKYYPAGATTHSDAGVSNLQKVYPVLAAMEQVGLVLSIHGEVTDPTVDIFDREAVFIDQVLSRVLRDFPRLKVVLEHITTREAVDFVTGYGEQLAATITPQHLLFNRNQLFQGGLQPHFYCLPVLKREQHRQALIQAAISGNPRFFLGTDSAPHARHAKEASCGCAGCFSAPSALELYAMAFEQAGALYRLEGFASHFGADFYGVPRNTRSVTLIRQAWTLPQELPFGEDVIVPLWAGQTLPWQLG